MVFRPEAMRPARRFEVLFAMLAVAGALLAAPTTTAAQSAGMSRASAYTFSFAGLDGGAIHLADYVGKPILVVTPPRCAATHRNIPACSSYGSAITSAG